MIESEFLQHLYRIRSTYLRLIMQKHKLRDSSILKLSQDPSRGNTKFSQCFQYILLMIHYQFTFYLSCDRADIQMTRFNSEKVFSMTAILLGDSASKSCMCRKAM